VRAMVLCAGLGTRLRPLTALWPKPAMPLLGQPLLRSALATLKRAGIDAVGINTHHLPAVMEATAQVECQRAGLSLEVSRERGEIQGTGGGIRGLRAFLRGDDFVVLNGDVLFGLELAPVLAAHRSSGALATMVCLPMPEGERYNAVECDADGCVRRIAGLGPPSRAAASEALAAWHFTGVHVLSPRIFEFMAPEGAEDINRDVYLRALGAGLEVRAHVLMDPRVYWSDLGTPGRYATTHGQLLRSEVELGPFGEASPFAETLRGDGPYWAHPSAQLGDVLVTGPAWFGAQCVVEDGARIGAEVSVGPAARVGAGARLQRVAVLDGAVVPPGAVLEGVLVAPGGVTVPTLSEGPRAARPGAATPRENGPECR
jgi:mannose-1-phosphate guanylyltransferase